MKIATTKGPRNEITLTFKGLTDDERSQIEKIIKANKTFKHLANSPWAPKPFADLKELRLTGYNVKECQSIYQTLPVSPPKNDQTYTEIQMLAQKNIQNTLELFIATLEKKNLITPEQAATLTNKTLESKV